MELGQLAVVAACFLTVGLFRGAPFYRAAITVPASLVIAVVGAYWFIERVLTLYHVYSYLSASMGSSRLAFRAG